jgi:hypothetical protein
MARVEVRKSARIKDKLLGELPTFEGLPSVLASNSLSMLGGTTGQWQRGSKPFRIPASFRDIPGLTSERTERRQFLHRV